ncbi:EmrB/QacA subfamily drug resistance transporter [Saccharopolyspora erythraea NRRL 2338]|uniref:Drug resistance transporter EmrB/QacA subfamily n=2 Tax=Saccharopolyspora erythraea TaxID=1836 RepID=A4FH66_SACEN|nr:MFS transporter [Saccharopolyspora erythraea]EQD82699.1 multidrug MFS transporter [Saccharopolyspora erythraea D]PFG97091.1 EmrB/QacA subfamily drug resistance transporter [Saccharopolyspora erythraea NRRL 2338]QRK87301.1 MFS transporter [Saccharopolyspora erythraea]CAM03391.1 drug resistance transporter EmrB/QacA subfamily [Saccharopolyspora erythraea NRRL 2338]
MNPSLRWWALTLVVAAEFVVFLDIAIVNVALPTMRTDLDLGAGEVSLVVDSYQVIFGGLLLVGGRIADFFGRKRVFLLGFGIFTIASLGAGLATSGALLIASRAVQGLGAALLVPATTALIVAVFQDERERSKAFGIWGAMRAGGASSGAALGGLITQALGWEWVFLINVPIGIAVLLAGPALLPHLDSDPGARPGFVGALLGTGGLLVLSAAFVEAPSAGWTDPLTLGLTAAGVLLLVLFTVLQARSSNKLVPGRVLTRTVVATTTVSLLYGASHIPLFLLLSFYLQNSLRYEPLLAGAAMLPVGLVVMASSATLVPRLMSRFGARHTLLLGLGLLAVALLALARAPHDGGSYFVDVLPAGVVAAVGLSCCFSGVTVPAVESVADQDTGIASGLVNSAQRIGSGLGVAVLLPLPAAGFNPQTTALVGAAVFAALGALVAMTAIPPKRAEISEVRQAESAR